MQHLIEFLREKDFLADGATGTDLCMRGLDTAFPPEWWNVEQPDDIFGFHPSFFEPMLIRC